MACFRASPHTIHVSVTIHPAEYCKSMDIVKHMDFTCPVNEVRLSGMRLVVPGTTAV